jgi:hypothetical protein
VESPDPDRLEKHDYNVEALRSVKPTLRSASGQQVGVAAWSLTDSGGAALSRLQLSSSALSSAPVDLVAGVAGPPAFAVPPVPPGAAAMHTGSALAVQRVYQRRRAGICGNDWIVGSLGGLCRGSNRQRAQRKSRGGDDSNPYSHFGVPNSCGYGCNDATPVLSVMSIANIRKGLAAALNRPIWRKNASRGAGRRASLEP